MGLVSGRSLFCRDGLFLIKTDNKVVMIKTDNKVVIDFLYGFFYSI